MFIQDICKKSLKQALSVPAEGKKALPLAGYLLVLQSYPGEPVSSWVLLVLPPV